MILLYNQCDQPSLNDLALTTKALEAGNCLDIQVCGHLILIPDGYFSFSDEGLI
ncbi:JAB domain-containing protein [uncultured Sphingobacterium sp.]|uniref:JAB domain-containing protein n=1 Tax=uncultured Sphingobacterium sp. TaxID=182688 RepID=UPI003748498F